ERARTSPRPTPGRRRIVRVRLGTRRCEDELTHPDQWLRQRLGSGDDETQHGDCTLRTVTLYGHCDRLLDPRRDRRRGRAPASTIAARDERRRPQTHAAYPALTKRFLSSTGSGLGGDVMMLAQSVTWANPRQWPSSCAITVQSPTHAASTYTSQCSYG